MSKIFIGIDDGESTGFAVWNGKEFLELETINFWEAITRISWYQANYEHVTVVVEDPSQNKPVFKLQSVYRITPGGHEQKLAAAGKVAQSVGRVKRESELMIAFCELKGIKVIPVRPSVRSFTKMTAEQFEKYTGYKKRTSVHARDAGMMVFGR